MYLQLAASSRAIFNFDKTHQSRYLSLGCCSLNRRGKLNISRQVVLLEPGYRIDITQDHWTINVISWVTSC